MTERERLIELICNCPSKIMGANMFLEKISVDLADYLLASGVIVPHCKVGDTIWRCGLERVHYWQIQSIDVYADEIVFVDDSDNYFTEDDIGKTVFLTKEEAEQALKGGGKE